MPHYAESKYCRSSKRFLEDLDFFTKHYKGVSISDLDKTKDSFHLTFDDGMSEIYSVVAPILKEKKLQATFFINTDFVDNKSMMLSHKINLVKYYLRNSVQLRSQLSGLLSYSETDLFSKISAIKSHEEIDNVALSIRISFEDYLREAVPYMTKNQIMELHQQGFTIGNHGKSHTNFNTLNFSEQKLEIQNVNEFLISNGIEPSYFCFPHGDFKIKNNIFEWMYSEGQIEKSFGISGLKKDDFTRHYHRILMEIEDESAEQILKMEYLYFMLKALLGRNRIRR